MADDEYRNTGFINIKWDERFRQWTISGRYTDASGKQWALGFATVAHAGLQPAIGILAAQIGPSIAGKGVPQQEWKKDANKKGPR